MKALFYLLIFSTTFSFTQNVLWQDTFDDPTVWTLGSSVNSQGSWDIGLNADVPEAIPYMGAMESSTYTDGFAFFDAIQHFLNGTFSFQESWIEMTTAVDMSAYESVLLRFDQRYMSYPDNKTFVEVSTDNGATWTQSVDINEDVQTNNQPVQNTVYHKFTVNNSNQVKFRFRWYASGSAAYGWMVDDINILSVPNNDLMTSDLLIETDGLKYFQIPEMQTAPINFSVKAKNMGSNVQYGTKFVVNETSLGNIGSSAPTAVLVDATDSLYMTTPFTPTTVRNYNVEFSVVSDFADEIPQNNQMPDYNFDVTNYTYARDNGIEADEIFFNNVAPEIVGNSYKIYQDQMLTGIDGYFHSNMDDNTSFDVEARLYEVDPVNGFILLEQSAPYSVQPGDAGTFKTFKLNSPVMLEAGKEYIAAVSSQSNNLRLAFSSNQVAPQSSWVYGDFNQSGANWSYTFNASMVRMNFDPCLHTFQNLNLNIVDTYCIGSCDGSATDTDANLSLYEYNWYDSNNTLIHTGPELTNVCGGDYSVTKEDQCGNSDQLNFTIGETMIEGQHSFSNQPASNCSSNDGEIVIFFDYSAPFSSSDITIDVNGPTNQTINTVSNSTYSIPNLLPGDYTLTFTDNENGCDPRVYTTTLDYVEIGQSLCVVTVDSANTDQNIVVWEKPADLSQIDSFFVYREITTNSYEKIGGVHVDSLSQFIDTSANPNTTGYRYKVNILNVCGDEETLSSYHNTIHLQFQGNGNFNWNHYQIENETDVVNSYNFYRDNESDGNWQIIQIVSGNQNTFTDPDFNLYPNASYFVDVNWYDATLTCQATKAQDYNSSRSNKYNTQIDLSVKTENGLNAINIRPNPTSNYLYIDNIEKLSDVKIISSIGQVVYNEKTNANKKLDVSHLKTGVYIIQIETSNQVTQKRFVKK